MKKMMFTCAALFTFTALPVFAGELQSGADVIRKNGWTNFTEVVQLSEAGKLRTGTLDADWPVLVAKFRLGMINERQCWDAANAMISGPADENELWPLWYTIGKHLVVNGKDAALSAELMELFETEAAGDDAVKRPAARRALGAIYAARKDYRTAWPYLVSGGGDLANLRWIARKALVSNTVEPAAIYAGLRNRLLDRAGADPVVWLELLRTLLDAAVASGISDAETAALLTQLDRTYAGSAVGESESAKAWGVFVGSVRETAKSYR